MRNTDDSNLKSVKLLGFGALTLRAALLGAAVSVALATHVAPALAGDDDDNDEPSIEQKVIRGLMHGLGAVDGTEKGIDYRERSPLVVPPKLNLPPPETRQRGAEAKLAQGPRRRGAPQGTPCREEPRQVEGVGPAIDPGRNEGRHCAGPERDRVTATRR